MIPEDYHLAIDLSNRMATERVTLSISESAFLVRMIKENIDNNRSRAGITEEIRTLQEKNKELTEQLARQVDATDQYRQSTFDRYFSAALTSHSNVYESPKSVASCAHEIATECMMLREKQ